MEVVPELLLLKRIHDANESGKAKEVLSELLKVVKISLDRHRSQ
jgi:hypothetical protein